MKTCVTLEPNIECLRDHLSKLEMAETLGFGVNSVVEVQRYGQGIDERIGWDTHVVLVDGKPWGFTDQNVLPEYYEVLFAPRVGPYAKRPWTGWLCGGSYSGCKARLEEQSIGDLSVGAIFRTDPPPAVEHLYA